MGEHQGQDEADVVVVLHGMDTPGQDEDEASAPPDDGLAPGQMEQPGQDQQHTWTG